MKCQNEARRPRVHYAAPQIGAPLNRLRSVPAPSISRRAAPAGTRSGNEIRFNEPDGLISARKKTRRLHKFLDTTQGSCSSLPQAVLFGSASSLAIDHAQPPTRLASIRTLVGSCLLRCQLVSFILERGCYLSSELSLLLRAARSAMSAQSPERGDLR